MEASGGSGSLFIQVLDWLWLSILLGSVVALLSSRGWSRAVSAPTRTFARLVVVMVLVEWAWRLVSPQSTLPLAAWSAALLVFSLALSVLDRPTAEPERGVAEPRRQAGTDATAAGDPFAVAPRMVEPAGESKRDSQESWASRAVTQTHDAVAVLDLDGRLEWANPAWSRLHGYRPDEVAGHHVSLFQTPEQMRGALRPWMEEVRATWFREGVLEHRTKSGETVSTRSTLTLLRDNDDEPTGFVMISRALPREAAADEPEERDPGAGSGSAKHESETLRILAGGVAHELNNALTGILGNASLIQQKERPELREEIQEIESASREAAELSKLLQAYAGRSAYPAAESLLLAELVRDFEGPLGEAAGDRATLRYELDDEPSPVSVDATHVRLVLRNLVVNAVEASAGGPCEITVRTGCRDLDRESLDGMDMGKRRSPGAYAFVEVTDNGHGMDAETISKMFRPFFTTRSGKRGLGLTAVRTVVRAHRGAIDVESRRHGTRVRIYFPTSESATREAAPTADAPRPREVPPREAPSREVSVDAGTILVVDNEEIIRNLATTILEAHGFSVLLAEEGEPAIALFRAHRDKIRGVLLDLSMPIMDGAEVYREIRGIDPAAPIVLMTGHDAESVRRSFEDRGDFEDGRLSAVLQKPFRPGDLLASLRGILR